MYNGKFECNSQVYDDMLRDGKMIHCVGGDDSHSIDGSGYSWTVIKAENLEYKTVTDALLRGDFYSSQGPEIFELYTIAQIPIRIIVRLYEIRKSG